MSHLRESVVFVLCGRKMSLGFCFVISPIFSVVSAVHVFSTLLAKNDLGTDYSERLVFPYENTACRNCKKHLLWHRFTL